MTRPPFWTSLLGIGWLVLSGSVLTALAAPNGAAEPVEYMAQLWDSDAGLPQDSVQGIAQTPDGYLWIATQAGLSRFDGVRFTSFLQGSTPGLESSNAQAVFTDRTGALWIGLERGGVARLRDGRFETIIPMSRTDMRTRFATSFAQDSTGAVWIGMAPDQAAYRWREGQLMKFAADDGIGPGEDTLVRADAAGRIWFATKMACGVFDGARFRPIDPEGGERVHLAPSRDGSMWATRDDKLLRYRAEGTREEIADLTPFGGAVEINTLYEDRAGVL